MGGKSHPAPYHAHSNPASLPSAFLLTSSPTLGEGWSLNTAPTGAGGKATYPKGFLQLFQPAEQFSLQSEPAAWPAQPQGGCTV